MSNTISSSNSSCYDCIIVGGGVSGLRCASLLKEQGKSVLVLEARDRVGGRTFGIEHEGYVWDVGGQWVGSTQYRLYDLIKQLGQSTFPQQQQGAKVLEFDGKSSKYTGSIPPLGIIGLIETQLSLWRFDRMIKYIDTNEPWKCKYAYEWDNMTVQQWIQKNVYSKTAKKLVHAGLIAVFSTDPAELSLLSALHYVKNAGGIMRMMEVPNGAQQDRILGGSYKLSQTMAERLGKDRVLLGQEVKMIDQQQSKDWVQVECANGSKYRGKVVVITVPPMVANSIDHRPQLPMERIHLQQRMPMGQVIKFIVFYDSCFWREMGYAGEIVTDRESVAVAFDASFEDGSRPAIVGFFEGSAARLWSNKSKEERKQQVLDLLYKSFDNDKRVLSPTNYIELDWMKEKYSLGGYAATTAPGVLTSVGMALREPVGRVHFAGTETATQWAGYIEGALESAERVSKELIQVLDTNQQVTTDPTEILSRYKRLDPSQLNRTSSSSSSSSSSILLLLPVLVLLASIWYKQSF